MANDREQQDQNQTDLDRKNTEKPKRDRVIGEGMTSLDSTQAPLSAETGLPDRDAMTGGKGFTDTESDSDDANSKR